MLRAKGGAGMDHDNYDDGYIRGILNTVRTIAMVGVSANTSRPSYFAFKYLLERGYRMIPVNPSLAGQELLGRKAYAALADIPEPVDMVDIFRASQYAVAIVKEALALNPRPKVIWMQLGIRNDEAASGSERPQGGDEPLPEARIRAPVVGDRVDGRQHPHHHRQEGAAVRPRHPAHGAQPRHARRRHDRRRHARATARRGLRATVRGRRAGRALGRDRARW